MRRIGQGVFYRAECGHVGAVAATTELLDLPDDIQMRHLVCAEQARERMRLRERPGDQRVLVAFLQQVEAEVIGDVRWVTDGPARTR